jgi:hypothetical protein
VVAILISPPFVNLRDIELTNRIAVPRIAGISQSIAPRLSSAREAGGSDTRVHLFAG